MCGFKSIQLAIFMKSTKCFFSYFILYLSKENNQEGEKQQVLNENLTLQTMGGLFIYFSI